MLLAFLTTIVSSRNVNHAILRLVPDENHEDAELPPLTKEERRCDNAYTRANKTKLESDPYGSHHQQWQLGATFRIANYSRVQKVVSRVFLASNVGVGAGGGWVAVVHCFG